MSNPSLPPESSPPPESPPEPEFRATRHRMVSNTVFSLLSYLAYLPINLVVTRFMVERLGVYTYGLWATLTTVMAFQGLLDLGVAAPLIKYVSEYSISRQVDRVNAVISTAMMFYAAIASVFGLILVLTSGWVLSHLFHSGANNVSLRAMYFAVVAGFSISLTFSVLQSLNMGLQRADVQARLVFAYNVCNAIGTVVALLLHTGLSGQAANWVVTATLLPVVGNWIVAKRLYPNMRLNPFLFEWQEMKRILGFSTKVQVSILALYMNGQVDRLLIAYALGPFTLSFYQLAQRATSQLLNFSTALGNTILPAVSEMHAAAQWDRVRRLYIRATRYQAMSILPITGALSGLAFPIFHAWLGEGFDRASITMIILVASFAVYLPNGATVASLNGIGRPDVRMRADIILVLIHVPLAILLIWQFGYFGTVAVTSSLLVCSRLYIFVAGGRELETPLPELLRGAIVQPAIGTLLAVAGVLLFQLFVHRESLPLLAAEFMLFGVIYGGYMLLWGFDDEDRGLLRMALGHLIPPSITRRIWGRAEDAASLT